MTQNTQTPVNFADAQKMMTDFWQILLKPYFHAGLTPQEWDKLCDDAVTFAQRQPDYLSAWAIDLASSFINQMESIDKHSPNTSDMNTLYTYAASTIGRMYLRKIAKEAK